MRLAPKIFGEEGVICSAMCVLLRPEGRVSGVGVQIEVFEKRRQAIIEKSPTSPLLMA